MKLKKIKILCTMRISQCIYTHWKYRVNVYFKHDINYLTLYNKCLTVVIYLHNLVTIF